jgi:hypothetical protein
MTKSEPSASIRDLSGTPITLRPLDFGSYIVALLLGPLLGLVILTFIE